MNLALMFAFNSRECTRIAEAGIYVRCTFPDPGRTEVAFKHAVEVDSTGRTIVMTCEREQAEFGRDQIHGYGADPRVPVSKGSMNAVVEPAQG